MPKGGKAAPPPPKTIPLTVPLAEAVYGRLLDKAREDGLEPDVFGAALIDLCLDNWHRRRARDQIVKDMLDPKKGGGTAPPEAFL